MAELDQKDKLCHNHPLKPVELRLTYVEGSSFSITLTNEQASAFGVDLQSQT
jgi:hypothetical protein